MMERGSKYSTVAGRNSDYPCGRPPVFGNAPYVLVFTTLVPLGFRP